MIQKTISKDISISGVGIHSGKAVEMHLYPAPVNTGICFKRLDQDGAELLASISLVQDANRATILSNEGVRVETPEHFLAACYGLGVDNLTVEISGAELPIMDGSAKPFVDAIQEAGIQSLDDDKIPLFVTEPFALKKDDAWIIGLPSDVFRVSYSLEYKESFVGTQFFDSVISDDVFIKDIAAARTYGFESEIQALYDRGLAKGGSLDNAVVIGESGYLNELRFPDELVRHKVLDFIGDLSLVGRPIRGQFLALKAGHSLNLDCAKHLAAINQVS
ncbi:UDP-3-O-[3-hydroxymyristoyl] N-acetylglucosamine deacetylase [Candidatus Marinamargulisbacteria bacterium SCGC AG-439-L15]|nr:UDP-3-O-[3-hydroxymyristoyl] N-acetylglucosamine deacetylase [Candidatus Marinamargulisbacteria bacterium SCGC AG-439-L15]